jgi:hypothetical protein
MVMFVELVLAATLFLAIVELLLFRGLDMEVSTSPSAASTCSDPRALSGVVPCS